MKDLPLWRDPEVVAGFLLAFCIVVLIVLWLTKHQLCCQTW
jgi:hypothetical protein